MDYATLTKGEQEIRQDKIELKPCFGRGAGGGGWGGYRPLRVSALVKTTHYRYCYMLSPLSLPCLPNDKVVFTMIPSASVCKMAMIYILASFFAFQLLP